LSSFWSQGAKEWLDTGRLVLAEDMYQAMGNANAMTAIQVILLYSGNMIKISA
jgi:hypothetical protein